MKVTNVIGKDIQGIGSKSLKETNRKAPDLGSTTSDKVSAEGSAKVSLSERMKQMQKIKDIATSSPDVDDAKVAKFRDLIDKGLYKMDPEKIADKLVDDHFMTAALEEE